MEHHYTPGNIIFAIVLVLAFYAFVIFLRYLINKFYSPANEAKQEAIKQSTLPPLEILDMEKHMEQDANDILFFMHGMKTGAALYMVGFKMDTFANMYENVPGVELKLSLLNAVFETYRKRIEGRDLLETWYQEEGV